MVWNGMQFNAMQVMQGKVRQDAWMDVSMHVGTYAWMHVCHACTGMCAELDSGALGMPQHETYRYFIRADFSSLPGAHFSEPRGIKLPQTNLVL